MPGATVDGNDILAVYDAALIAVERARSGGGPTLLEARTYRMKGHAEHDGQAYVPREELEEWGRRDPIELYAAKLLASGEVDAADLAAIDRRIAEDLDRDVEFAEKCPPPAPGDASGDLSAAPDLEPAFLRRLS